MPGFTPPEGGFNARAVVLLLLASALCFAIAGWDSLSALFTDVPAAPVSSPLSDTGPTPADPPPPHANRTDQGPVPANRTERTPAAQPPVAASSPAQDAAPPAAAPADPAPLPSAAEPVGRNETPLAQAEAPHNASSAAVGAAQKTAPGQKAGAAPKPAQDRKPSPDPRAGTESKPGPGQILGLGLEPRPDEFVLTVRTDRKIARYTSMNLDSPKKLAVDIHGVWNHKLKPLTEVGNSFIRAVIVGEHPGFLRVVLVYDERARTGPIRPSFSNGAGGLTVRLPR